MSSKSLLLSSCNSYCFGWYFVNAVPEMVCGNNVMKQIVRMCDGYLRRYAFNSIRSSVFLYFFWFLFWRASRGFGWDRVKLLLLNHCSRVVESNCRISSLLFQSNFTRAVFLCLLFIHDLAWPSEGAMMWWFFFF